MVSILAEAKMFSFWPKTMSGVFNEIELIFCSPFTPHSKEGYEAEIWTILLFLRYAIAWYQFWVKSKLSVSGRNHGVFWTIIL